VTLDCANDWGDDEIAACKGAAEQLGKIGIAVSVHFLSSDPLLAKVYNARATSISTASTHGLPEGRRTPLSRAEWQLVSQAGVV
jgi:hypothetical protein